jgi:autotransporter adhesin
MANNKLILRNLNSPWVTPVGDITKGSVLSWADMDNNFIYLRGEVIYTAETSGDVVTLKKINGEDLSFNISYVEPIEPNLAPVLDNTLTTPPIAPDNEDRYIIPSGSTGDWSGQSPNIAEWSDEAQSWVFYTPVSGDTTIVTTGINAGKVYQFNGVSWIEQVLPIVKTTPFFLAGTGVDAGGNKTSAIQRSGNVLIGGNSGTSSSFKLRVIGQTLSDMTTTRLGFSSTGDITRTNKWYRILGYRFGSSTYVSDTFKLFMTDSGNSNGSGTQVEFNVTIKKQVSSIYCSVLIDQKSKIYGDIKDNFDILYNSTTKELNFYYKPTQNYATSSWAVVANRNNGNVGNFAWYNSYLNVSSLSGQTSDAATIEKNTVTYSLISSTGITTNHYGNLIVGEYITTGEKLHVSGNTKIIGSLSQGSGTTTIGDYSSSLGVGTSAMTQSSFAAGENSIANASETIEIVTPITVISACTITLSDPEYSLPAVVFDGDVNSEWSQYIGNFCSEFLIYNNSGDTQFINVGCGYYTYYYDLGTDKTYIVDTTISADTYTTISGATFYYLPTFFSRPAFAFGTNAQALGVNSHAEGENTIASGDTSHSEGENTTAGGYGSHAEGGLTTSSGDYSHAEGVQTLASGYNSHAEGYYTTAEGYVSHAEGNQTTAIGSYGAHAEGNNTIASGDYSHAEGGGTQAIGSYSHAEGGSTIASGSNGSHAEGFLTIASGTSTHAEGRLTTASGDYSHAEGQNTIASGQWSHSEGLNTIASGQVSHAEGQGTTASGLYSHAEGGSTKATGQQSHAEGGLSTSSGAESHAEGGITTASGGQAHSEGRYTIASGNRSHAEGDYTTASGSISHAEGQLTTSSGQASHAEGYYTIASGNYSHAEGRNTTASAENGHAEGYNTKVTGDYSHAEGQYTTASGLNSHSEGANTTASGDSSHAEGASTTASGYTAHAEGDYSKAGGYASHAEGQSTTAIGDASHAEGQLTKALGNESHAEGQQTTTTGDASHAEGRLTTASGENSHSEGRGSIASGSQSHAEGYETTATGVGSHAEGGGYFDGLFYWKGGLASGQASHAEGSITTASGNMSHAEGYNTTAIGDNSHVEGENTTASGYTAHAEGLNTKAIGDYSHAEGQATTALGPASHAEGIQTTASGQYSHAEGYLTTANGENSHSEGRFTIASGDDSHAEGRGTEAISNFSHAGGYYSIASGDTSFIHSYNSVVTGDRSVVLGGQNLTGSTSDTVYVPNLSVNNEVAIKSYTPNVITSNQDNYPTSGYTTLRLSTSGATYAITGFADGYDGKILIVHTIGPDMIQYSHEDVNSLAANRFLFQGGSSFIAQVDRCVMFQYDGVSQRWRLIN